MFLLWIYIASLSLTATTPKVALLPCERLFGTSSKNAERLDSGLREELGKKVSLIPSGKVIRAMSKRGIKGSRSCDDKCLTELGKALGADRVVSQTFSFQRKMQVKGGAWVWIVHQVDVQTGKPFGHFERVWVHSAPSWWDIIIRSHAKKLAEFDPKTRLKLVNPREARPTKGPIHIPGMVYVPEGEFIMGSEFGELDEEPRHVVYLDAYYIDKYEVTNEAYERCVQAEQCQRVRVSAKRFLGPKHPAVAMGYDNAVSYCSYAGKRLPTEAEWEKAARGTDERRFPWGNEWRLDWVNMHHAKDGFEFTAPVGSFPENVSPYGAYDMSGNAWEWTQDWANDDYYKRSPKKNPKGPESGIRRVMRGGSWNYDIPFYVTTTNRSPGRPWIAKKYVGFRCVKDVPKSAK
ncbi:MAG: formylglycine-generating enzyme family protein [Proteobacteria bacterium]|nr:formylglycine-generating enzyme family protein [Pseudomonadota bacterium]